ncbi:MAG: bifunctional (p)ppGpp synthetase/guanosine-3',5'-bis(diphosphate) 3'-pyrophosphohydrolase [Acidobacteria bacterium]|nr:bifunctional (p)ppGpp synthetase/guanosine-3',5'-bis(diphosphate) 3'-pyrophosphohydrolase [Acidobacteriota bacterium]
MEGDGRKPGALLREGENLDPSRSSPGPSLEAAFEGVKKAFLKHHPDGDLLLLEKAFKVGKESHGTQLRQSGEPFFFHPLAVARSLAEWQLDAVSVACGMLHDTVEDTRMTQEEVRKQFGEEVSEIVDGLTKISKLAFTDRHLLNAENVRKLLVAMGKDVRVLLVKLADRLHNMETLDAMRLDKRRRIAWETLELYAPLANRLGMGSVRSQLEDLSFATLEPERFSELKAAMEAKRLKNLGLIAEVQATLDSALRMHGIQAKVYGRSKHLYGIWKKMGIQAKGFEEIHDWLAYRIICPDRATCYTALGLVHAIYKPIPGRFKDYISLPKDNGYQSIHTSVLMPSGDSFEVQIRTQDMHEHAEGGIASHWTYKEGRIANRQEINQVAFLRRMVELHQDAKDSRDLVANLKGELSFRRIQIFTPKGDLRSLPEGATPVDFAYSIHTEVGHRCIGAKVNGRMVPLRHVLQNGDRVEVLTRNDHKPSRDWLGFVKSATARSRIQAFIREEERKQATALGKERLEKEARNFGVNLADEKVAETLQERLKDLKLASWDAAYAALGFSRITVHKLLEPLVPESSKGKGKQPQLADDAVTVEDNLGVLYYLALCCKPIFGDEIVGYITRGRGIAIHRGNCPQLHTSSMHPDRRVSVAWGRTPKGAFDTEIALTSEDRPGMVAAISESVQKSGINMQRFNASSTEEGTGLFHIALRVKDRIQLLELMAALRKVRGVLTVERVRGSVFGKLR